MTLKKGMNRKKVPLRIALGIALGVFHVLSTTKVLWAAAAILLRSNLKLIQLVNKE